MVDKPKVYQREVDALSKFAGKTGIVSYLFAHAFESHGKSKRVIFLPFYDHDLKAYVHGNTRDFSLENKLSLTSQWLEGLATISEKGVHADIKYDNLLIKHNDTKVEGVIADFSLYRDYNDMQDAGATEYWAPPEYFTHKELSNKHDVWSLGLCLYWLFLKEKVQPFKDKAERLSLKADWIKNDGRNKEGIPDFIIELINDMLHPDPEKRLSAKEALARFRAGREAA